MAARQHSDWALEELGIRRVSLRVGDHENQAVLKASADALGVDATALASLLATATEMGRGREADAGLVAYREGTDGIVVLSSAALRSEGLLWAGVAHELSNALTTIGGWASVAAGTLDEKESRKAITVVAESAREAMDVAPLLLEREGDGESSDAARVASQVLGRFTPVAAARGVTLTLRHNDAGEVSASRAAVSAIVANLVKNAIEACRDGGRVDVSITALPRAMEILVEDDGRGMTETVRRGLFGVRAAPRESGAAGRGVGLSVVHGLVVRANGKVGVTSKVGVGSCVRVELPRSRKGRQSSGVRRRATPQRVLIVEDHASIAELLTMTLASRGAQVYRTADPDAALAEARRAAFDVALVDLDLGAQSGDALIQALVRSELATRVIVMSGTATMEATAAHGVLRKPFDLADLDELLERPPPTRRTGRPRSA